MQLEEALILATSPSEIPTDQLTQAIIALACGLFLVEAFHLLQVRQARKDRP